MKLRYWLTAGVLIVAGAVKFVRVHNHESPTIDGSNPQPGRSDVGSQKTVPRAQPSIPNRRAPAEKLSEVRRSNAAADGADAADDRRQLGRDASATTAKPLGTPSSQAKTTAATNSTRARIVGGLSVQDRYRAFFDSIGTDAATRDKVIAAISAYEAGMADVNRGGRAGLGSDQKAKADELTHEYQQRVTELLGPDGEKALEQYGNIQMFVPIAEEFANRCSAAGQPIGNQLLASIASIYADDLPYPNYVAPNAEMASATERFNAKRKAQAIDGARKLLTPAQLEIFGQYWSERPFPEK